MTDDRSLELATWIAQMLDKKGGVEISVIETKNSSAIADYIVIATGTSSRHVETLLDAPIKELKKSGFPPLSVEGEGTRWWLADLGDVILHIFDEPTRKYFDLDGLWRKATKIDWNEPKLGVRSVAAQTTSL